MKVFPVARINYLKMRHTRWTEKRARNALRAHLSKSLSRVKKKKVTSYDVIMSRCLSQGTLFVKFSRYRVIVVIGSTRKPVEFSAKNSHGRRNARRRARARVRVDIFRGDFPRDSRMILSHIAARCKLLFFFFFQNRAGVVEQ